MRVSPQRFAVTAALCATSLLAIVHFLLEPLHQHGVAQAFLGRICALGYLLELPLIIAQLPRPTPWWLYLSAVLAFYFVLGRILHRLLNRPVRPPTDGDRVESRRSFFRKGATAALGVGTPLFAYAFFSEPFRLKVVRRSFPIRGLPKALDGLRIVQLTDVHLGPWITLEHVQRAIAAVNELEPDLILLTGDYVHRSPAYIAPAVNALTALKSKIGMVGVLGNHDWQEDGPLVQRTFAKAGIPLIDNSRRILTPDRKLVTHAAEGLCLAGVGDLWRDEVLIDKALGGVPRDMPRLLLSHNPDVAELRELIEGGHRVDLMLSGHTHGGQVWVPLIGTPIVPSRFGQKYAHGLVQGPACPVFVCSGVGMTVLPFRFRVPPEVAALDLVAAD